MPWEILIVNENNGVREPLGSLDELGQAFAESLPGVECGQRPVPPQEYLDTLPPFFWEHLQRPLWEALYEDENLSIHFYTRPAPTIEYLNAEVRGNGDPLPIFAALCQERGWKVIDSSNASYVDFSAMAAEAWERFCTWRDHVISQHKQELDRQ